MVQGGSHVEVPAEWQTAPTTHCSSNVQFEPCGLTPAAVRQTPSCPHLNAPFWLEMVLQFASVAQGGSHRP